MLSVILALPALALGEVSMRVYLARLTSMSAARQYITVTTVFQLGIWTAANLLFPSYGIYWSLSGIFCGVAFTWYFARNDKKWRSLLLSILFYTAQVAAVNTAVQGMVSIGISAQQILNPYSRIFPLACLVVSLASMAVFHCVTFAAEKIFAVPAEQKLKFWMMVPLLMQMIFLFCIYFSYYVGKAQIPFAWVFAAAALTVLGVIFSYGLIYRKYMHAEEKSWKLQQVESQLQIQTLYFDQMQHNIQHVNQIRHDLNNQLQAAYYLLENGNKDEVRSQLDALKASVANRVGPRFCPNLMVDAVLSEKAELCRRQNIPLELSVELPAEIPVENVHLCSIFSNLLDNSIHAMQKRDEKNRAIRLQCGIRQGFLVIRCENPGKRQSQAKNSDPMREHGLGLAILQQLAEKYDGHMETRTQNGCFSVTVMLNLVRDAK